MGAIIPPKSAHINGVISPIEHIIEYVYHLTVVTASKTIRRLGIPLRRSMEEMNEETGFAHSYSFHCK